MLRLLMYDCFLFLVAVVVVVVVVAAAACLAVLSPVIRTVHCMLCVPKLIQTRI